MFFCLKKVYPCFSFQYLVLAFCFCFVCFLFQDVLLFSLFLVFMLYLVLSWVTILYCLHCILFSCCCFFCFCCFGICYFYFGYLSRNISQKIEIPKTRYFQTTDNGPVGIQQGMTRHYRKIAWWKWSHLPPSLPGPSSKSNWIDLRRKRGQPSGVG